MMKITSIPNNKISKILKSENSKRFSSLKNYIGNAETALVNLKTMHEQMVIDSQNYKAPYIDKKRYEKLRKQYKDYILPGYKYYIEELNLFSNNPISTFKNITGLMKLRYFIKEIESILNEVSFLFPEEFDKH